MIIIQTDDLRRYNVNMIVKKTALFMGKQHSLYKVVNFMTPLQSLHKV